MNQEEFFQKLNDALYEINETDKQELLAYYKELISDGIDQGISEEKIITGFGNPINIAEELKKNSREYKDMMKQMLKPEKQPTKEDAIHTIVVDAQDLRIELISAKTDTVRVLYDVRPEIDSVSVTVQNGEYCFKHRYKTIFSGWLQIFFGSRKIQVEVPECFTGNLDIKTRNAKLIGCDIKNLENAKLVTSNASIQLARIECGSMIMKTSNSSIQLDHVKGKQMEASTSNGHITASDCTFPSGMLLGTSNATIHANRIASDKIALKTCNAAISGTIIGKEQEYNISGGTSNGSSNLRTIKQMERTKYLAVATSNGKIQVDFL